MKKLYEATVTIYVMAEDEAEAQLVASRAEIGENEVSAVLAHSYDGGWKGCYPYGQDRDDRRTVDQIVSDARAEADAAAKSKLIASLTAPLPGFVLP